MSDNTDDTNPDTTDDTGDTGDDDSLWSNLTNKIAYKIHNAATDPNANKFAAERAKKRKEEKDKKLQNTTTTAQPDTTDDSNDPDQFSAKRLAKKVGNQTLDILKKVFFPFMALMLAMIVANEAIVYSVPIRIIFFIFTFLVCFYAKPLCILLGIFYILKGGYSYYVNNMTDRPKQEIMPTIYALLPITTYKPMSSLGAFLLYPFTYPKTDEAEVQLPKTMKTYYENLEETFPDLDKVKNLPIFVSEIKQIQKDLSELHNPKGRLMTFGGQEDASEPITNNTNKTSTNQGNQNTNKPPTNKPENGNKSANGEQPTNKPANGEQPANKTANQGSNAKNVVNNSLKLAAATGTVVGSIKNGNKAANGEQPANKVANGEQPANKVANGEQPANKAANGEQPANKAANGEQPANKAANGEQPANKVANGEQPANKVANGEQPANKAANGEQPANKAANGEQPANKAANNKSSGTEKAVIETEGSTPVAPPNSPTEGV